MSEIEQIFNALTKFRDQRNWMQFHNAKDLALALSIEAAELNELFLWKSKEEIPDVDVEKVGEELADILAFAFLIAEKYNFDIKEIMLNKIQKNAIKYPIGKSKNKADKYTNL